MATRGSVQVRVISKPVASSHPRTPPGRNFAEISVRISSPAANSTVRSSAATCTVIARRGPQPHLDPLVLGVPERDVVERVDVEVGAQLAVEHAQHVAVELGGDARRRRRRRARASAGRSPGRCRAAATPPARSTARSAVRNAARSAGSRLPMVPPRNATIRRPPPGSRSRCRVKSPTTPCTRRPG